MTSCVSIARTSSVPELRIGVGLQRRAPLRRMLVIAPARPLALDQRLGRRLELQPLGLPALGDRVAPGGVDPAANVHRSVAGHRERRLGPAAEAHIVAPAVQLVAQDPATRAARSDYQPQPSAVVVRAGLCRLDPPRRELGFVSRHVEIPMFRRTRARGEATSVPTSEPGLARTRADCNGRAYAQAID